MCHIHTDQNLRPDSHFFNATSLRPHILRDLPVCHLEWIRCKQTTLTTPQLGQNEVDELCQPIAL